VALSTDRRTKQAAVALHGVSMNLVATETGNRLIPIHGHLAHIAPDMPVTSIELCIIGPGKVDLEVLEEIVSGNEAIRERTTGRARLSSAEMALGTERRDNLCIAAPFL
jgi:hypothetical protein